MDGDLADLPAACARRGDHRMRGMILDEARHRRHRFARQQRRRTPGRRIPHRPHHRHAFRIPGFSGGGFVAGPRAAIGSLGEPRPQFHLHHRPPPRLLRRRPRGPAHRHPRARAAALLPSPTRSNRLTPRASLRRFRLAHYSRALWGFRRRFMRAELLAARDIFTRNPAPRPSRPIPPDSASAALATHTDAHIKTPPHCHAVVEVPKKAPHSGAQNLIIAGRLSRLTCQGKSPPSRKSPRLPEQHHAKDQHVGRALDQRPQPLRRLVKTQRSIRSRC